MRGRWANYKSHIRTGYKNCEIATHVTQHTSKHPLDKDNYNKVLSEQFKIIIIDEVDFSECKTKKEKRAKIEILEGYWQTTLRTMMKYGGLNKFKDDRVNTNKRK